MTGEIKNYNYKERKIYKNMKRKIVQLNCELIETNLFSKKLQIWWTLKAAILLILLIYVC